MLKFLDFFRRSREAECGAPEDSIFHQKYNSFKQLLLANNRALEIIADLENTIYQEMRARDHYLSFHVINPVKDKATRGKPYQKRHRAGGILFDKEADWYPAYEAENLRFTGTSDAAADDQFDSSAILVKGFEASTDVDEEDFMDDDELEIRYHDPRAEQGRSAVTGY